MEAGTKQVTDQQLLEAEKGLVRLLHKKRFPRDWIESHAPEAMAQARVDLAARLAAKREDETVGLLVTIGYRKALKILSSQCAHPPETSIETVFQLVDESTPTPEEEAIKHDREERVARAMSHLPERERKLMALVYFEGMSIRAAGRRVGWGRSVANRHHKAAVGRLEAMLDRSLLGAEIAIPAFVASGQHSLPKAVAIWIGGAAETLEDAVNMSANRIGGLLETGNAAAMSGAGRTGSAVCGAVVVACVAGAATGVVGPGVAALDPDHANRSRTAPPSANQIEAGATSTGLGDSGSPPGVGSGAAPSARSERRKRPKSMTRESWPVGGQSRRAGSAAAREASPKQTVEEFGVEGGDQDEATTREGEQAIENAPIITRPPAASDSSSARPAGTSPKPSPGTDTSTEFGM